MNYLSLIEQLRKEVLDVNSQINKRDKNYFLHAYYRFIKEYEIIQRFHDTGKFLEIGSAPFFQTRLLSESGLDVTGVDINPSKHESFIQTNQLNIVKCDIENGILPFNEEQFNTVLLLEVFEHLRIDPIKTLNALGKVLKKGGNLIVQTPNLYSLKKIKKYLRGEGFDNAYNEFEKLHTLGYSGHVRIYTMKQMCEFLEKTGFTIVYNEYNTYNRFKHKPNFIKRITERMFPELRHHLMIVAQKN